MAEEVKRKRGRPRKNPVQLPEEVKELVKEVQEKSEQQTDSLPTEEVIVPKPNSDWDVTLDDEIKFFDKDLSYELTGYRPINDKQGLDFDPSWFTEARDTFKRTGHYCSFKPKQKAYRDFWKQEYTRCREGMTVNGYTITGDHYFFLNYYKLNNTTNAKKAMSAVDKDFPDFIVAQYEYLHYLEICKRLRKNAALMKARALGFSEMNASITANFYSTSRNSTGIIVAAEEKKLTPTLSKLWEELSFLNYSTDGGFFKLRQVHDKAYHKKASRYEILNGQKVEVGFGSQLIGIIADTPDKVRGYRCGLLVFEEAGSFPNLTRAVIQGEALLDVGGNKIGISLIGGTGGDARGAALEGLRNIYYNPEDYDVLPYRHSYTQNGEIALTGYFLPSYSVILKPGFQDNRGYTDPEKAKAYWQDKRDKLAANPKALVDHCAERCFNAEEAFALEGENKFNKALIAEQLTRIRALKQCPPIETGFLEYSFKDGKHAEENINGFKWIPNANGKIKILEHPLWTLPVKKDEDGNITWTPPDRIKNLYVIGIDGIDIGSGQTSENTKNPSDFCLVVKKRVYGLDEPQYVAIYKDRPNDIREAYRTAVKLAQYYNAVINIEATRQSIIPWAREKKFLKYFMKRPRATLTDSIRNTNKQYGTPATLAIIAHQTDLIADYINDYSHTIWFDAMLDEFNRYTDENKRKFDIVAAVAMCELADEELAGVIPKQVEVQSEVWQDIGYYTDEHGCKRWGVIPKQNNVEVNFNNNFGQYVDYGYRTSDSRIYQNLL